MPGAFLGENSGDIPARFQSQAAISFLLSLIWEVRVWADFREGRGDAFRKTFVCPR